MPADIVMVVFRVVANEVNGSSNSIFSTICFRCI